MQIKDHQVDPTLKWLFLTGLTQIQNNAKSMLITLVITQVHTNISVTLLPQSFFLMNTCAFSNDCKQKIYWIDEKS